MARPKSFNESNVLTNTMTTFWQKGYEGTSMRDLEKASGLTAGSIYNEFGNKKQLFIRSLKFYINTIILWRAEQLNQSTLAHFDAIKQFLVSAVKDVPTPFRGQSCLLINTATELGQTDQEIAQVVNKGFKKLETTLLNRLYKAHQEHELKENIDPIMAANSLIMTLSGLLMASKMQAKTSKLERIIDFQLQQMFS